MFPSSGQIIIITIFPIEPGLHTGHLSTVSPSVWDESGRVSLRPAVTSRPLRTASAPSSAPLSDNDFPTPPGPCSYWLESCDIFLSSTSWGLKGHKHQTVLGCLDCKILGLSHCPCIFVLSSNVLSIFFQIRHIGLVILSQFERNAESRFNNPLETRSVWRLLFWTPSPGGLSNQSAVRYYLNSPILVKSSYYITLNSCAANWHSAVFNTQLQLSPALNYRYGVLLLLNLVAVRESSVSHFAAVHGASSHSSAW